MRMKWLAFLGCALLSLSSAAFAESSTALTLPAQNASSAWSSAAWSSGGFAQTLAVSFPEAVRGANQTYWTMAPELWTAQDAISAPPAHPFVLQSSPSLAPATPECGRPASISNAWNCSIKPLTRYDLPLRHALRHLWPLGGNKDY